MSIGLAALPALFSGSGGLLGVASMAIGAASQVANYIGQSQQAAATNEYNRQLRDNARTDYNYHVQQDQQRMIQEADTASAKLFAGRIEALRGSGAASAAGYARGVEGHSVDALAAEYWTANDRNESAIRTTQNNVVGQLMADEQAAGSTYVSRVNAARPVSSPSLLGLGLGIAGAVAGGFKEQAQADRIDKLYAR